MVEIIPRPDPQTLFPPLLACLPTAFASSRPPPALLPLLSPILRQRLQLITSQNDDWLRLLCWDREKGDTLHDIIESANFEPHPSSGEIEVGDIEAITYKRFDPETIKAQIILTEWSLTALFLWCSDDQEGSGWKLAELLPYDAELERDQSWSPTVAQANEKSRARRTSVALAASNAADRKPSIRGDDEDYWAMYDRSPSRTPAMKRSPAPDGHHISEADYYSRYGDVQPAMDDHDPEEEMEDAGEHSLKGGALANILSGQSQQPKDMEPPRYPEPGHGIEITELGDSIAVDQPVASSSSSHGSDTVARLEKNAEQYAASEVGVRQHIGTTMKSMYRLARSIGMDREEFDRIVQRELETLSIFDRDD